MKKLTLLLLAYALPALINATVPSSFSDDTKFHWRLEVIKDNSKEVFTDGKINSLLEINHNEMAIKCAPPKLLKEHIKYHPKKNNGYTRDEERSQLRCTLQDTTLTSNPVVCARSYAKNKIGQVSGDSTDYSFKSNKGSFSITLSCILK
jgi:hypothetical protein